MNKLIVYTNKFPTDSTKFLEYWTELRGSVFIYEPEINVKYNIQMSDLMKSNINFQTEIVNAVKNFIGIDATNEHHINSVRIFLELITYSVESFEFVFKNLSDDTITFLKMKYQ